MTAPSTNVVDEQTVPEERPFTLGQRMALFLISWAGYLAIAIICRTVRFTASSEEEGVLDAGALPPSQTVAPFWHRCVFSATYFFRSRGISVMTSRSFDGEYIARIIEKFGFRAVRGSSSRGGVRALLGMHTVIEANGVAAFTIDGPRGPAYVAKPGPVLLARNTGAPIRCFYIAVKDAWVLNSWDRFVIPKPFTRAHVCWSRPILVPRETDSASAQEFHAEMQAALERVRDQANSLIGSSV
ncbi:MAG TPA: lysophospholipid acyltransferase family protein [Terriglobales bacterium]|nr:lysophospholipid acyltransferase family protein [Terriglobales bacterium]